MENAALGYEGVKRRQNNEKDDPGQGDAAQFGLTELILHTLARDCSEMRYDK